MKVYEELLIPGMYQDTTTYKYESNLSIDDVNKIIEDLVEKGNDIMGVGVKRYQDHSDREPATVYPKLEDYLEKSKFIDVKNVEQISFTSFIGDLSTSNVIYPNNGYRTSSVWNEKMLKYFEEKKNNNTRGL